MKNNKKKNIGIKIKLLGIFILGIIIYSGFAAESISAANTDIKIKLLKKIEIQMSQIHLGKISQIRCKSKKIKERLDSLVLGKSPKPGKIRSIKKSYIVLRLRQMGINPSQYTIQGPEKTAVTRKSTLLTKEKIKNIVEKYIYNKQEWSKNDIEIKNIKVYSEIFIPANDISYSIVETKYRNMNGILPLLITFKSGDKYKKRIRVLVKMQMLSEVVVANRPLRRHRRITSDDVLLKKVNIVGLPKNIVTKLNDVIGKRTKGYIRNNSVLRGDLIELPPLMKRGDMVLIIAETRGMKITAIGQAKKDGRLGERISVMNLDSKKMIFAQVVDFQTVRVEF